MEDPLSALRNRLDGPLPAGALGGEDHEMALQAFLSGGGYKARIAGSQCGRERRDEAAISAAMTTRGAVISPDGRVDDPPLPRTEVVDRDDLRIGRDLAVATEDPGVAAPQGGEGRHRERRRQAPLELHRDHLVVDDVVVAGVHALPVRTIACLLYTSPSPRDRQKSRMPSSA